MFCKIDHYDRAPCIFIQFDDVDDANHEEIERTNERTKKLNAKAKGDPGERKNTRRMLTELNGKKMVNK